MTQKILILGIGNTLLSDEGVGVHLIDRMRASTGERPGIEYLDGGTLSFTLAEPIASASGLIVVDAARMNQAPGSVRIYRDEEMDEYLQGNRASVHEVSLGDLLDIARLSETLPAKRCLVGIEPQELDWGESPSPVVSEAIDRAIEQILELLGEWQTDQLSGA
ncbi:MAG: HyaD/HybD family hydrogenase maturation endopeptidase [Candidatus Thiodiazotropha sp.]